MKTSNAASSLKRVKICLIAAAVCALIIGAQARQARLAGSAWEQPVGLSLFFRDGAAAPITLVGDAPRDLQEIDIVATVPTQGDQGIEPLIQNSELTTLANINDCAKWRLTPPNGPARGLLGRN
jgi:hypothetical protein